jgi:hypothetical protein
MIDKGQIPRNPLASFSYDRRRLCVQNDPDLYKLASILELYDSKDGLVKCTSSLDDVIVYVINGCVDRNSRY